MNPEEQPTLPEEYAVLLAVCDDLLAQGQEPVVPDDGCLSPEMKGRLLQGVACLQRLERLWPRRNSLPVEVGWAESLRPTTPAPVGLEDSAHPTAAWTQVPGYEILGELGRGGMGVVYKARQIGLNRLVALKMIQAGAGASPQTLARFRTEAVAIGRLQHPHIVQIHDIGAHGGQPYFSLELVEGGSLAQKLAGQPQPAEDAAHFIETLARAVHHAHQNGIVHRDLKPANILLASGCESPSGEEPEGSHPPLTNWVPKISDFGLAKLLEDDSGPTCSGTIVGTPSYMAPEQAGGPAQPVGPGTDVYALGAILYEMLTGQPPFQGESAVDILQQVRHDEPMPPRRWRAGLARDLDIICLKCLEKEPARRYVSALALGDDLHRFLHGEAIRARPVRSLEKLVRWGRRNPALAALVLVVQLLLVTIAVAASLTAWHFAQERDWAVAEERTKQLANERLRDSYLAQARVERLSDRAGRRFAALELLDKAADLRPSLELRNEAIACLALTDLRLLHQWQVGDEQWVFFDQQLRHYASGDSRGNFRLCRVADGREMVRLPGPGHPGWVAQFSPDGRFFAARHHPQNGDTRQIRLWDLSDSAAIHRGPVLLAAKSWDFSPDNRLLAAGRHDGRIVLYRLPSGQVEKELVQSVTEPGLAFHPTGRKLAVSIWEPSEVRVYAVPEGQLLQRFPHPAGVWNLAWSEDGRRLAAACADGKIYVWGPREKRPPLVLDGHQGQAVHVTFNHAGDLLASAGWDSTLRLWRVDTGQQLLSLAGDAHQPRFSADDRRLGWFPEEGKVSVYEMAPAQECRLLGGQAGELLRGMDFSPDGRLLATAGRQGVALWDALDGRLLARLPVQESGGALFAPDGKGLLISGRTGLWHWPIVAEESGPGLVIGPPRRRAGGSEMEGLAQSADGRTLAVNLRGEKAVVLRDEKEIALGCLEGRVSMQLSPDGRWATSDVWHGKGTKIWNAHTGEEVQSLPGGDARVVFSPDGRWLGIGRKGEYQLLEAGTWQPSGPRWARRPDLPPGFLAFRPDSQVLAITPNDRAIRLVDCATGRELATLTSPDPQPYAQLCFSRDGARLAALCGLHNVQIWDLTLIRRRLAQRNLHDDFPWAAAPEPPPRSPVRLQVRLDHLPPWREWAPSGLQNVLDDWPTKFQKKPTAPD